MSRPKMTYRSFGFDAATLARLRAKAKAHKVSQAAFVRALINGHRAGAELGSDTARADAWWDTRPPSRRVSVWRNHANPSDPGDEHADQPTIFEGDQQ